MHAQAAPVSGAAPTRNAKLLKWVEGIAALTQPDRIHWCDGSQAEYDRLCAELVAAGTMRRLNDEAAARTPISRAVRSLGRRAGRGPHFHLLRTKQDAGPTNNWVDPAEMRATLDGAASAAACAGRTMYVVPFSMGPLGSHISHIGVEITDSPTSP